jgi:tetratricopeptide (TPR) repeat protein
MNTIIQKFQLVGPRGLLAILCLVYLCVALATFRDYGINPDEGLHIGYGASVVAWYTSGFAERGVFTWTDIWAYGGIYDVLSYAATEVSPFAVHETRHLLNAIVGLVGLLGAYSLGQMVGNRWMGLLAAVLLLLTPRYYGHAFFNHKDIPFAVGYVWSVVLILRCYATLPIIPVRTILLCGLAIGFTLGIKVGGAILVFYLTLVGGFWLYHTWRETDLSAGPLKNAVFRLSLICAVAYGLMLLAWPWAQLDPLLRPWKALTVFSNYSFVVPVFFEGEYIPSNRIPWYYTLKWLVLTLPEVVLVGSILGSVAGVRYFLRDSRRGFPICLVGFTVLFPLIYAAIRGVPFYNGMRHILFVLPLLAVLAANGITALLGGLGGFYRRGAIIGFGIIALTMVYDLVAFHPNQYVYFNRLFAGGIAHASRSYETDYYANSFEAGIDWLTANADPDERKIAAPEGIVLDTGKFEQVSPPSEADFYLGRNYIDEHLDVPGHVIYSVRAGGTDILTIVRPNGDPIPEEAPNESTASFFHLRKAYHLNGQGRGDEALKHFKRAAAVFPRTKGAQESLARTYFDRAAWEDAAREYEALLLLEPGQDMSYGRLAATFHHRRIFEPAEKNYLKALELRDDQYHSLTMLGSLYVGAGKPDEAIPHLETAYRLYPSFSFPKLLLLRALVATKESARAIRVATMVTADHPEIKEAHSHLIRLLIDKEAWPDALDAIHTALAADPNRANLWHALARVHRIGGELDSAIVALDRGLSVDPGYPDLHNELVELANALIKKRRFADALKICQTEIERAPGSVVTQIGLAESLIGLDRVSEARLILNKILSHLPNQPEAKRLLHTISQ